MKIISNVLSYFLTEGPISKNTTRYMLYRYSVHKDIRKTKPQRANGGK